MNTLAKTGSRIIHTFYRRDDVVAPAVSNSGDSGIAAIRALLPRRAGPPELSSAIFIFCYIIAT